MTNLRRIRKQERLTMQALADLSGVSESAIGMYETELKSAAIIGSAFFI